MASHAFEPHTGEVRVRIEAAGPVELFAEAARALAELLGTPSDEPPGPWRRVELTARDREALLVAWINELIARAEIEHRLHTEVAVDDLTPRHLAARVRGAPFAETRTAVKAATLHGLEIREQPGRASATLILDV